MVPRHIFGVENKSHTDVEFVSEEGNSIGTLGGDLLSCSPGSNFAYLPLHTSPVLRVGKAKSVTLEVDASLQEQMLFCNVPEEGSFPGVLQYCFLLRSKMNGMEKIMELIPALFIVNRDSASSLSVRHTIRAKSDPHAEEEWIQHFVIPAAGVLPYTFLSYYGYSDFFEFSWEEGGGLVVRLFHTPHQSR